MNRRLKFIILSIICVALLIIDVMVGSVDIAIGDIISIFTGREVSPAVSTIILDLRLPKAVTALLAGSALSVSGLQMQTMFRNPLAGPYVMGLSSGASLGVALLLLTGLTTSLGLAGAAMLGAGCVMALLLIANERINNVITLLILGVMFSSAIGAVVQILQYLSNEQALKNYVVWTMGSLGEVTHSQLKILSAMVIIGLTLSAFTAKALNLLMLGDRQAVTLGLNLRRARLLLLTSTTLLAGAVTAFCGPIGFIGMAVPHIARRIFLTADHRVLIAASILTGIALLVACDIISRQFMLPINSITSLAGIPVVIYVVLRK